MKGKRRAKPRSKSAPKHGPRKARGRPSRTSLPPPAWVFRCAPGLAKVLTAELRSTGLIDHGARPTVRRERNHDLVFLPKMRRGPSAAEARIAEEVLQCLVYGRYKVTDAQLDRLAGYLKADRRPLRIAASVAGSHFDRLLFARWLGKQLIDRGLRFDENSQRALRIFCIDQDYYVCTELRHAADTEGRRDRTTEREGSLPGTIAAAMAFLAKLEPDDTVIDPVCGSGTLLAEAHAYQPTARLIGFDTDEAAVRTAKQNLDGMRTATVTQRDGRETKLSPGTADVILANLPFGRQFGVSGDNPALYADLLAEAARIGVDVGWRAVMITSDEHALKAAARKTPGVKIDRGVDVVVRGEPACIHVLTGAAQTKEKSR